MGNCTRCSNCSGCKNCTGCSNSDDCVSCINCENCSPLKDCSDCVYVGQCTRPCPSCGFTNDYSMDGNYTCGKCGKGTLKPDAATFTGLEGVKLTEPSRQ